MASITHPNMLQEPVAVSDDEIEFHWDNMVKAFGSNLPNPDHEPRRFNYYVKLYKYLLTKHGEQNDRSDH